MIDEPSVKEMAELWRVCYSFLEEERITYQDPRVAHGEQAIYGDASSLVDQIADIIGYYGE